MQKRNVMGMPENPKEVNADGSYEYTVLSFRPMYELMRERGVTDLELSRMTGEKVEAIRKIQLKQDTLPLSIVRKLCHALKCDPSDLMAAERAICIPAKKKDPDV